MPWSETDARRVAGGPSRHLGRARRAVARRRRRRPRGAGGLRQQPRVAGARARAVAGGQPPDAATATRPTLVMLAHPRCTCTRASVGGAGRADGAGADARPRAYVVFIKPGRRRRRGWEHDRPVGARRRDSRRRRSSATTTATRRRGSAPRPRARRSSTRATDGCCSAAAPPARAGMRATTPAGRRSWRCSSSEIAAPARTAGLRLLAVRHDGDRDTRPIDASESAHGTVTDVLTRPRHRVADADRIAAAEALLPARTCRHIYRRTDRHVRAR